MQEPYTSQFFRASQTNESGGRDSAGCNCSPESESKGLMMPPAIIRPILRSNSEPERLITSRLAWKSVLLLFISCFLLTKFNASDAAALQNKRLDAFPLRF